MPLRYDAGPDPPSGTRRRLELARAKNTERSAARRRHRARVTGSAARATTEQALFSEEQSAPAPAPSRPGFQLPDVRADIRALPGIFRTRRLL